MPKPPNSRPPKSTEILSFSVNSKVMCEQWREKSTYKPHPKHKRNPSKFSETLRYPIKNGSICEDFLPNVTIKESTKSLQEAFSLCMVSKSERQGFPARVWAVIQDENGKKIVCEARFECFDNDLNRVIYHGYPYEPSKNPFYLKVIKEWDERKNITPQ